MFEQLMKYPIDIFQRGDFSYGIRLPGVDYFSHPRCANCGINLGRTVPLQRAPIVEFGGF